jgi:hypothetical protein
LKQDYAAREIPIEIYARIKVGVNGRQPEFLIDPKLDLTKITWNYFSHNDWILPQPKSMP